MFRIGELVKTIEKFDGLHLVDHNGTTLDQGMNSEILYIIIKDDMLSTRIVVDPFGRLFKMYLEQLESP